MPARASRRGAAGVAAPRPPRSRPRGSPTSSAGRARSASSHASAAGADEQDALLRPGDGPKRRTSRRHRRAARCTVPRDDDRRDGRTRRSAGRRRTRRAVNRIVPRVTARAPPGRPPTRSRCARARRARRCSRRRGRPRVRSGASARYGSKLKAGSSPPKRRKKREHDAGVDEQRVEQHRERYEAGSRHRGPCRRGDLSCLV